MIDNIIIDEDIFKREIIWHLSRVGEYHIPDLYIDGALYKREVIDSIYNETIDNFKTENLAQLDYQQVKKRDWHYLYHIYKINLSIYLMNGQRIKILSLGFFYNALLQDLKERGRCVIAITHDNQYFNLTDKFIRNTKINKIALTKVTGIFLNMRKNGMCYYI